MVGGGALGDRDLSVPSCWRWSALPASEWPESWVRYGTICDHLKGLDLDDSLISAARRRGLSMPAGEALAREIRRLDVVRPQAVLEAPAAGLDHHHDIGRRRANGAPLPGVATPSCGVRGEGSACVGARMQVRAGGERSPGEEVAQSALTEVENDQLPW